MPKRRKGDEDEAGARRSTNACHRCKSKKIKCFFRSGALQSTCVACHKARTDCVFDVTPDGIPRGAEYMASLESRVAELQEQLRSVSRDPSLAEPSNTASSLTGAQGIETASSVLAINDEPHWREGRAATDARYDRRGTVASLNSFDSQRIVSPTAATSTIASSPVQTRHKVIESASDGVTIFNFLAIPPVMPESERNALPELPQERFANAFLETTYLYTQGRYCLVDWVQVREWHPFRDSICHAASMNDPEAQSGAYFIWMMYAIGAQLTPNPPNSPAGYYARALKHLPAILSHQNLTTVQALLVMIQYFYRSPGGPSMWHLAGAAMRLCVELGLHRKTPATAGLATSDPYKTELKKRLFWCAYCFDRSVSILSKRPFGIHDFDIDVELPVDVDVMCLDREVIQDRQALQVAGESIPQAVHISTITSSLHHLRMYRLQSRILARFAGIRAALPTPEEIFGFLEELNDWREHASRNDYPPNFPHQTFESVQASYYMTALLVLRTILVRPSIDGELLKRCALLSADACENEKALCFSPQNHNSPVRIYNCFRCGLTLLQCLAISPTVLPARSALRAINSCSSALSVYTGALAVARSYLRLFDKLSDYFFGYDANGALCRPDDNLRGLLQQVTSCDPSDIPDLLKSLSTEESSRQFPVQSTEQPRDEQSGRQTPAPAPNFGMDLIPPFEILENTLRPDLFQEDMLGFWGGSFVL